MATAIDDNVEGKNLGKQLVKLSTGQHTSIVSRYDTEDFEFCGIRRSGNTAISTVSEYIRNWSGNLSGGSQFHDRYWNFTVEE